MLGLRRKRNRLEARVGEFRAWWLGLDDETRAQNEADLRAMGEIGTRIMSRGVAGDEGGFAGQLWSVLSEAGLAFFALGQPPGRLLLAVKDGAPEIWGMLAGWLPPDLLAQVGDAEGERARRG